MWVATRRIYIYIRLVPKKSSGGGHRGITLTIDSNSLVICEETSRSSGTTANSSVCTYLYGQTVYEWGNWVSRRCESEQSTEEVGVGAIFFKHCYLLSTGVQMRSRSSLLYASSWLYTWRRTSGLNYSVRAAPHMSVDVQPNGRRYISKRRRS